MFNLLVFPGFVFLSVCGFFAEYIERKLYARFQNRIGPPWYQTIADFIKLSSKEEMVPESANPFIFRISPIIALTAAVAAFIYIPIWSPKSLYSFNGDIIVVLYLLTIPTFAFVIGGWYSFSLYSKIGSVRALTQLFAYEAPLFIGVLTPSLLANTWSLSELTLFYINHPLYALINFLGFFVSIIALIGKLEKAPFDIPEAETEIVAGGFTEYSGRLYAILRLTLSIELIVCSSLLVAVFLPFGLTLPPLIAFLLYVVKILFIVVILSLFHAIFARLRIDQMISMFWKYLVPLALLQTLVTLIVKGVLK